LVQGSLLETVGGLVGRREGGKREVGRGGERKRENE
jgi:hypothetical protein